MIILFENFFKIFNRKQTSPAKTMDWVWPMSRHAGELVTPDTAMTFSAVYRAVALISQTIGFLPWGVYRGYEMQSQDPVHRILSRQPNPEMTPISFKETLIADALTWGNGFAEIEYTLGGVPAALWRIDPSKIEVIRDDYGRIGPVDALVYLYTASDGRQLLLPSSNIFHIKALGDGLFGKSIVGLASRCIGMGLAAERFGASLLENQAIPGGVLLYEQTLSEEAWGLLSSQFKRRHGGSRNAGGPIILEGGVKFEQISMKPEDVQFHESRQFQVQEVCRWFGVPPHKLADLSRATFSNIEQQEQEFINTTLMSWAVRLEQEANVKLLGKRRDDIYTKINFNALLRGDSSARMKNYVSGVQNGIYSANEVRALEDMPPFEGGDVHLVQMQMTQAGASSLDGTGQETDQVTDQVTDQGDDANGS